VTSWLIDTSALARLARSTEAATWTERIERGLVRISTVTRLEIGYSARSGPELRTATHRPPLASMPVEYQTPAIEDRAIEVQLLLADLGHHRAPSVADLIVAATAELAGLTVVHLDKDFEMIAEVTAQPIERLLMPTD
jgi:predicted nucleic acid-binding protein